jgi:hypothetical protein
MALHTLAVAKNLSVPPLISAIFFFSDNHNTNVDTYTRTNTHIYKHTYAQSTFMSTSERLNQLDLEIHEVGHQEHIAPKE